MDRKENTIPMLLFNYCLPGKKEGKVVPVLN
jgi:hypothetical protein